MSNTAETGLSLIDAFAFDNVPAEPLGQASTAALWGAVDTHQQAIEQQLERHIGGRDPDAWPSLLAEMAALEGWHEQSRDEVLQLLSPAPGQVPLQRAPRSYRQTNLAGALAEARVQWRLGTLSQSEHSAIERCLGPLLQEQEVPQAYQFQWIVLAEGTQREPWQGALVLDTLVPLAELPTPPRLLLYRFGVHGGWSAHSTSEALLAAVQTALGALPSQQVSLAPAPATAFDHALDQRVAALTSLANDGSQNREARERTTQEALDELTVPVNPPRLLALARVEETRRSLRLGEQAQTWLSRLPPQLCTRLARLISDYAAAVVTSDQLLRRDLPSREAYAAARVSERLASSFALSDSCRVYLKLPSRVDFVREIVSGSGAAGTPSKRVPRPSRDTELISLEALAVQQIDEQMAERLPFLEVQVSPGSHPQRAALVSGITPRWLRQMVSELDVAGSYERLLADVHLRAGRFQGEAHEHEQLTRPFALMLEMHWLIAAQQGRLDSRGMLIAERACHATDTQAWRTDGLALTLRPAALTLFDRRLHSSGSTLAGVTFIHDTLSDTTLLYLPQAPDGQTFRQYPSLVAATEALTDLFVDERLRRYLCERALEGEPRQLENLVNQALIRGYRHLVSAREPWPSHHSLARNQYLAELGLKVMAHRYSSTSNADRLFNDTLDSRGKAVGYIKLALGFIPFVGSAIALVDALEAGIEAGGAFASGDSIRGLEATESVLLSIADALFDFGPGALAVTSSSASLLATARARQLRHGLEGAGRLRQLSSWSARRADEAFRGYESTVRLTTRPGSEGRWRNVFREPTGSFITRGSHTYAVQWDEHLHTWRLAATPTRTYRQPIALDEAGRWQTHGHLYGSLVEGGLRGGGGVQSYIADRLDPLWPDGLRRLLPRWWTDAHYRHQYQLNEARARTGMTVMEREEVGTALLDAYKRGECSLQEVLDATDNTVAAAVEFHDTLEQLRALARGRRFAAAGVDQSRAAATLISKTQVQIKLCYLEAERLTGVALAQRDAIHLLLDELVRDLVPENPLIESLLDQVKGIRATLLDLLKQYDRIEHYLARMGLWQKRVTVADHRRRLHPDNEFISRAFAKESVTLLRVGLLTDLAPIDDLALPSWPYMRRLYTPARERFDRVAQSSFNAGGLNLRPQQRQRLKAQLKETTQSFIRTIRRLLASYPEQFDLALGERLIEELRKVHDGLTISPVEPIGAPNAPRARVFEGDDLLLVGEPVPGEPDVLVIPRVNNRQERWTRTANQAWVQAERPTPAAPTRPLAELARNAQARLNELPAFRLRLQRYASQRILPADLEDLYLGESQELTFRIRQLREADIENRHAGLVRQLDQEAERLRTEGHRARIDQTKASTTPTGGHLEFLVEAREARIRKIGNLQLSGATPATRNWLQEYEIVDSRTGQALWYAHFHYRHERPRFGDFLAAHLKTPAQRFLGSGAAGDPVVWRGEISRQLAKQLFEPLFV